ncbi:MAG: NlpC/P60 family protein [Pseudomonadota bacterium]
MSRPDVVALARRWIGTPYHHQASCEGVGTDCLGLVRGVWRGLYGGEPCAVPAYSPDWAEADRIEVLWRAAGEYLREIRRPPLPGDVVLFRMRANMIAKHLGIVAGDAGRMTFIHAYARHGVIESPFSAPWQRRAVAVFEFP